MPSSNLQTVNNMISRFDPINLDEMDTVKLMDRVDMKFILPFNRLDTILAELYNSYRVLTICEKRVFGYRTAYFDTPEMVMFFDHHNGKLKRYKVRHREYIDSQMGYLEVKYRSNNGRVIKQRIEDKNTDKDLFEGFVSEHTPYNPGKLSCTVISHFNRFTLVDLHLRQRVTIDFNLAFSDKDRHISLKDLVIIEIKQDNPDKSSSIYHTLKKYSVKPSSLSKYCVGISLLNEMLKANNFKKTILQINKVSHVESS